MNIDNEFDLIIAVVFATIPQLGGLGPNTKDLVIHFSLGEGETLPEFHIRALTDRSELDLIDIKQEK